MLAIETSCDETAAAVVEGLPERGPGSGSVRVLSSVVASQADLHAQTKGVVPEIAARAHVEVMTQIVEEAINRTGESRQKTVGALDAVAVTTEPGLKPALVIGETAARALCAAWGKPFIPVHHIAGHIAAAWLTTKAIGHRHEGGEFLEQEEIIHQFPIIILVASGGHTQLYRMDENLRLQLLGQTRDDAAGEAFDKIARLLGLPYPGGPALATLAERGDARAVKLPRPMIHSGNDDFSFSGLKTAVLYALRDKGRTENGGQGISHQERANFAASAEEAIVDVLVAKTVRAAAREGAAQVILTGGVAANARLRARLREALGPIPLVVPQPRFCTDNAAMIGAAALLGFRVPQ